MQRRAIVIVLAALDLDVLLDQLPAAAVEERLDRARCASSPRPLSPWRLVLDAQIARRTCRDGGSLVVLMYVGTV